MTSSLDGHTYVQRPHSMQSMTLSFFRESISLIFSQLLIRTGSSPDGQLSVHLPKRRHFTESSFSVFRTVRPLLAMPITNCSFGIVRPIIGPPAISFTSSAVYPPHALISSEAGVPTAASTFFGSLTPSPETVTILRVIGMPFWIALPTAIAVETLSRMQPASAGSLS